MLKKNAKILCLQLFFICVVTMILQTFFDFPLWVNMIIPATGFMIVYLSLQVYEAVDTDTKEISKDGITGSRLGGIMVNAILFPWALGLFPNIYADICIMIIAILCLNRGRKKFVAFFRKITGKKSIGIHILVACSF